MVMGMRDLRTKVLNKTGLRVDFDVKDSGTCPLRGLPPGGSQSVSLSLVRKCCRERGSVEWPIRVLINKKMYGMCLLPHDHLLKMTRIVLRFEWREDGSRVPILEGVKENFYDRLIGCCINWKKRSYVKIAEADSTWPTATPMNIRSSGVPNIVEPNNITSETATATSAAASGKERDRVVIIHAFPAKKKRIRRGAGGGRTATLEPDHLHSGGGVAVESRQPLSLRRRDNVHVHVYSYGFLLALTLVASVHFFW